MHGLKLLHSDDVLKSKLSSTFCYPNTSVTQGLCGASLSERAGALREGPCNAHDVRVESALCILKRGSHTDLS
jgi:hypothetical protein